MSILTVPPQLHRPQVGTHPADRRAIVAASSFAVDGRMAQHWRRYPGVYSGGLPSYWQRAESEQLVGERSLCRI